MGLVINEETREFQLNLYDFRSGLNTRDVESLIKDEELSGVRNFTYDSRGGLTIRKGFARLITTAWIASAIKNMGGFYKTASSREEIMAGGTTIGKRVSEGITISTIKSGLAGDGERFCFHQYLDHLFMANTSDNLMVYDGTSVWDIGYDIPGSNCSAADGGSGLIGVGVYKYKITYKYIDGESNACEAETSVSIAASHKVSLTGIPTGGSRVTGRGIYRTVAGGSVYKLLAYINDNSTVIYEDNINDSGLGADMDVDNLYSYIRDCRFMINHKGRVWYAGNPNYPETLFYSKSLSPEANPASYYWDIAKGSGDEITGLAVNLGALIIFKRYSTHVITGDTVVGTTADMVLDEVNPTIGCVSNWTISHAGNDLIFLTPKLGVQRLKRIILADTESMDTEALSDKISTTINEDLQYSLLSYSHGLAWNNKYYLFVPSLGNTHCDIALVLDLTDLDPEKEETIRWTIYDDMNFDCSAAYRDDEGEHIHVGSSDQGLIYALESGDNDDGAVIEAWATTKNFDFGSFLIEKVFRCLSASFRASEDFEFTIRYFGLERDYDTNTFVTQQHVNSFSGGGAVSSESIMYDTVVYDNVMYDSESDYVVTVQDYIKSVEMPYPAHKMKFKIEDISVSKDFIFYGFELRGYLGYPKPI